MITLEKFKLHARDKNVIPLEYNTMADLLTPVSAYLSLRRDGSPSFLFETVEPNEKIGRYSFIGIDPILTIRARDRVVSVNEGGSSTEIESSIFDVLAQMSARYRQAEPESPNGLPGGFVGFIGYDNVRHLEHFRSNGSSDTVKDDAILGLFTSIIRFDHKTHLMTIVHSVVIDSSIPLDEQYERGRKTVETLALRLRSTVLPSSNFTCDFAKVQDFTDRDTYCESVRHAKNHIFEGNIFQVVLSRKIQLPFTGDLIAVYRALRTINPSPYLFFLEFGDTTLIGSSPEVLVKVQNNIVEVFPIAGTRRRGMTENEDLSLEDELMNDAKELAEHVMLVDLGRNDVGRVCEYGSVDVPVFKRVERYSHVMHLVSEVRGTLRSGASSIDALKSCFPAGTVSGAPKLRAMEIIAELEPTNRGVYAGAVGYLGFDGSLDTCIAIRTIVAHPGVLTVQTGAGIVADSVPEREYDETMNKSSAMLDAIKLAAGGLSPAFLRQNVARQEP